MSGQQAYIYQKNNKLSSAAITAAVAASIKPPLIYPVAKKGNGNINLSGAYSGADDAAYDVKITDSAFTAPSISSPVFNGAGTGIIKDISATGINAQKIRVLCLSTGVTTQPAEIEIEGVRFRAKATGAAGNSVDIIIDDSSLVYTDSTYSTIKGLAIGDTGLAGQEWDWDTKIILGDIIPSDARRVSFGKDKLNIYLQYKKYEAGAYKYYFIKPTNYATPAGTKVYFVTGGRTITIQTGATPGNWAATTVYTLNQYVKPVTANNYKYKCTTAGTSGAAEPSWPTTIGATVADGTAVWTCEAFTEAYTGIITIADFWTAVRTASNIIEPVDSSIDTSRTKDSPAVREMVVKTSSYFLPPYKANTDNKYTGEIENITTNAVTKTELIEVRCRDNSYIGQEIWDVRGSSSGGLGQAKTGEYNEFGPAGFSIPQKFPDDWGTIKEDWSHKAVYMDRGAEDDPPICFSMALGIMSQPQAIALEYRKRPRACACPAVAFSESYLGFEEEGGEVGMAYTVPDLSFWTDAAMKRMQEAFKAGNTAGGEEQYEGRESAANASWNLNFRTSANEYIKMFKELASRIFALPENVPATLTQMVTDYKVLVNSLTIKQAIRTRQNSTKYNQYDIVVPATPNGYAYMAVELTTGTWPVVTGAAEPSWPTTIGAKVLDGALYFLCLGATTPSVTATWNGSAWSAEVFDIDDVTYDATKYFDLVDDVLDYEKAYGVKKNSVIVSEDGSYQEVDSEYYWDVRGSKGYLPAFTDIQYYSTVKSGDTYINTKEFAFHISVPCGGALLEGDQILVTIGGIQFERTYKVGDITYLPTVAASNLEFSGGIDGDDTYVWSVSGDINAFPDYLLDRDNPQPYSHANLALDIDDGIILFQVGDQFEFNVEGGHFQWRKNAGAWSGSLNISATPQTLDSGLNIAFAFGVSPSFELNDQWEVLAVQENKAANCVNLADTKWKGTGDLTFDIGSSQAINALVIDKHDYTGTIVFQASALSDFSVLLKNETITVSNLICKLYLTTPVTARYFRIIKTGTHSVGHIFIGNVMQISLDCDSIRPLKRYNFSRQEGKDTFGLLNYTRKGYSVNYSSFIFNADYLLIDEMIEYLKTNNDLPLYFAANINYPAECMRGKISIDTLEPQSEIDYNAPEANRIYSLAMSIEG